MKTVHPNISLELDGSQAQNEINRGVQLGMGKKKILNQAKNVINRRKAVGGVQTDRSDSGAEGEII